MFIYHLKNTSSRSFTQRLFLKSGGTAIIRMRGMSGVLESDKAIPEVDLNFILSMYRLELVENEEELSKLTVSIHTNSSSSTSTSLKFSEVRFIEDM